VITVMEFFEWTLGTLFLAIFFRFFGPRWEW
jgi:hypothetical protein